MNSLDLLNASGLVLASLGFFYTLWDREIADVLAKGFSSVLAEKKKDLKNTSSVIWYRSIPLTIFSFLVTITLISPTLTSILSRTLDEIFHFGNHQPYSPIDALLVLIWFGNLGVFLSSLKSTIALFRHHGKLNSQIKK